MLDVATSDTTSIGTVNVLKGRGDGSFSPMASYYAYTAPVYLATGDFNNDGYDDFACPNSYAASAMTILLNNGDGTECGTAHVPNRPDRLRNRSGRFRRRRQRRLRRPWRQLYMVHYGKGDGTFHPEVVFSTPAGRLKRAPMAISTMTSVDFAYPSTNGVTVVMKCMTIFRTKRGASRFGLRHLRPRHPDHRFPSRFRLSMPTATSSRASSAPFTLRAAIRLRPPPRPIASPQRTLARTLRQFRETRHAGHADDHGHGTDDGLRIDLDRSHRRSQQAGRIGTCVDCSR